MYVCVRISDRSVPRMVTLGLFSVISQAGNTSQMLGQEVHTWLLTGTKVGEKVGEVGSGEGRALKWHQVVWFSQAFPSFKHFICHKCALLSRSCGQSMCLVLLLGPLVSPQLIPTQIAFVVFSAA